MNRVDNYILNELELETVSSNVDISGLQDIRHLVRSRQSIELTIDEFDTLASDKSFWFYESDAEMYKELETIDPIADDVTSYDASFMMSDYVGGYEKYIPDMGYLQFLKKTSSNVIINVHDAFSSMDIGKRHELLQEKIKGIGLIKDNKTSQYEMALYDFSKLKPSESSYSKFSERKYVSTTVPCFKDEIKIIAANVPFEFYNRQILRPDAYSWNVDTGKFEFYGLSEEAFVDKFSFVVKNGLPGDMVMRWNGETLTTDNRDTLVYMMIATLLKLPTVPLVLYITNEDTGVDYLMKAIWEERPVNEMFKTVRFLNKSLTPYIIACKPDTPLMVPNGYAYNNYPVINKTDYLEIRCLDDSIKPDIVMDNDAEELHKQLQQEAEMKLSQSVETTIKMINNN